ncbi:hypothetical protein MtrunA17_Chr5g0393741 [Medicago truncatula]|uniref:Uncharacterized protein n=1 Tax=Medicago truncatula TaxID=3880 RepID=A0A396HKY1_MEDTR|nr:hypothetical protein MtrunA17_Chr5g0393741 [Medicago truncatula]
MEGLIPYIIGAISRKQKFEHINTLLQHSDSSKCLLLGPDNGSFRRRTRESDHHFQPLVSKNNTAAHVTANNNLRNRRH